MSVNIDIEDNIIQDFTDEAKSELKEATKQHCISIINEAKRLESTQRSARRQNPEISRHTVKISIEYITDPYRIKSKKSPFLTIMLSIVTFFSGGLFDLDKIQNDKMHLIFFLITSAASLILIVVKCFKDGE